jgi:eukaryotic-like serine/threonine-protein kinase
VVGELVLGRFLIEQRLGSGGYGTVYRAWDGRLERDVAVKVIEAEGEAGRRVMREAQAAARLNHPGIVTLYELGEEDGRAFLVSELVEGETLRDLSLDGRLSDREIGEIGADLCEALDHAHSRAVVHRDIKPQNVLVTDRDPCARLMDFGIARVTDAAALTATGDVVGTLAYMAPEQAEGQAAGVEADTYALALTLYECWSGENPQRRTSPAATARALGTPLPPLGRKRRDLPPDLVEAIDAALAADPHARPPLEELGTTIEGALGQLDDTRSAPAARGAPLLAALGGGGFATALALASAAFLTGLTAAAMIAVGGHALVWALALVPLVSVLSLLRVRLGYWAASAGLVAWLAFAAGRPGAALALGVLTVPPGLALGSSGVALLAPPAAPAFGVVGAASAFPLVAALADSWRARAIAAAGGFAWLAVAEVALRRDLLLGAQVEAPRGWQESAGSALTELLLPLLTQPRLIGSAALWALVAVLAGALIAPLLNWASGRALATPRRSARRIAAPAPAGGNRGSPAAVP